MDAHMGTNADIAALQERISKLEEAWAVHEVAVPLDLVAKDCHSRLRDAHAARFVIVETDGARVQPEHGDVFVWMLFEDGALRGWPRRYAGGGLDEPAGKRQGLGSDRTALRGS